MMTGRYFFWKLSSSDKKRYEKLVSSLAKRETKITCTLPDIEVDQLVHFVLLDNPQFFAVNPTSLRYSRLGTRITIYWDYILSEQEYVSLHNRFDQLCVAFKKMMVGLSDYEKLEKLYQLFSRNVTYDLVAPNKFNIIGCLIEKRAVCQGIAYAFKFLCDQLGLQCLIIEGTSKGEGHAWNLVRINQKNYHIDVTWDLFSQEEEPTYFYFCQSDNVMEKDHDWVRTDYPTCNDNAGTYFVRHNLVFSESELVSYLAQAQKNGKTVCHFQIVHSIQLPLVLSRARIRCQINYVTDIENKLFRLNFI